MQKRWGGRVRGSVLEKEERDVQDVSWLNDQAPSCPNHTSGCESYILGEGELLCGTGEIGDTGEDETPLLRFCQRFVDTSKSSKQRDIRLVRKELDMSSCGTDR
jgi:hypothetical protein